MDRTLVGATLEDTSLSIYGGGIYSQLIYGESFEEPRLEGANEWTACPSSSSPRGFSSNEIISG